MSDEILRYVDSIHREKGVDKGLVFESVEQALLTAARRKFPEVEELRVRIHRETGEIRLLDGDRFIGSMDISALGRIAAQTAKQVMIQRIREAERDVVFDEYERRTDSLVTGTIQRMEHGTIIVNMGRIDAILPRQEQVEKETYRPGESMRFYILNVKKKGQKVLIILSRSHPSLVKQLFIQDVPEIFDHTVEIKGLVREAGYRTKIAVASSDNRVDPVGACVGVRGNRIRNIVEELNGEKLDIVRWNESPDIFIRHALAPAEIQSIRFHRDGRRARVIVEEDQLSLAIGSRGQNVRLSSKLTGFDLEVLTVEEHAGIMARGRDEISSLPGVDEGMLNNLLLSGFESFDDIVDRGPDELVAALKNIDERRAKELFDCSIIGKRQRDDSQAAKQDAERAARKAAAAQRESAAKAAELPVLPAE